jgi:uncharacterized protein (DUF2147 family)
MARLIETGLIGAGLIGAAVLAATPALAGPAVLGVWSMNEGKAAIAIDRCGSHLCGRIVDAAKIQRNPNAVDKHNRDPALRGRKLKGLLVLSGFSGGPEKWRGGHLYNPSDGGTYSATLEVVDEDTLEVTGCIVRPICKSTRLTRISDSARVEAYKLAS